MIQQLRPNTTYSAVMGSVLSIERKNRGFEQIHVANHLGITQASWSRIENGISAITVDQLTRTAEILKISAADILRKVEQAVTNLKKQGIVIEHANPKELAKNGVVIIAAAALIVLVLMALKSK